MVKNYMATKLQCINTSNFKMLTICKFKVLPKWNEKRKQHNNNKGRKKALHTNLHITNWNHKPNPELSVEFFVVVFFLVPSLSWCVSLSYCCCLTHTHSVAISVFLSHSVFHQIGHSLLHLSRLPPDTAIFSRLLLLLLLLVILYIFGILFFFSYFIILCSPMPNAWNWNITKHTLLI